MPGEADYDAYLRSEHWQRMRRLVLSITEGRCRHCRRPADDVHHKTYERLGAERITDLVALCRRCHLRAHKRLAHTRRQRDAAARNRQRFGPPWG